MGCIRALAELVDAGDLSFEPDVEYDTRDTPGSEEFVNITWAFAVRAYWLAAWAADMNPTVAPR